MSERFIRIFKKFDIKEIGEHLLIYGDLSGNCAKCNAVNLKLDMKECPECKTDFKYISFRNIKSHLPKLQKIIQERPQIIFVDHEDFKKNLGAVKAQEFLK